MVSIWCWIPHLILPPIVPIIIVPPIPKPPRPLSIPFWIVSPFLRAVTRTISRKSCKIWRSLIIISVMPRWVVFVIIEIVAGRVIGRWISRWWGSSVVVKRRLWRVVEDRGVVDCFYVGVWLVCGSVVIRISFVLRELLNDCCCLCHYWQLCIDSFLSVGCFHNLSYLLIPLPGHILIRVVALIQTLPGYTNLHPHSLLLPLPPIPYKPALELHGRRSGSRNVIITFPYLVVSRSWPWLIVPTEFIWSILRILLYVGCCSLCSRFLVDCWGWCHRGWSCSGCGMLGIIRERAGGIKRCWSG